MSWLFSQALVEEYSAATSLAGEQCAPLNVMPTPHRFWRNDKTMESSQLSRFGLKCVPLTADRGEELLTSFRAAFRAKTSAPREAAPASKVSDPAYGKKWRESSARFDLPTLTWRTHHCLWDEVLQWSSVTLPAWGLMRHGVVFQRLNWEPHTTVHAPGWSGETLPTPSAVMWKGSSQKALTRVDGRSRLRNRLDYWVERDGKSGRLNPEFAEWVMGWPIGWTDVAPLEMDRFQEWQRQHGTCWRMDAAKHDCARPSYSLAGSRFCSSTQDPGGGMYE